VDTHAKEGANSVERLAGMPPARRSVPRSNSVAIHVIRHAVMSKYVARVVPDVRQSVGIDPAGVRVVRTANLVRGLALGNVLIQNAQRNVMKSVTGNLATNPVRRDFRAVVTPVEGCAANHVHSRVFNAIQPNSGIIRR
jgi:hypothetical protein